MPFAAGTPAKVGDFSKIANDLLSEDYQTSGFQFKAKQKTSFDAAVVTSTVDLWSKGCATPAKLSWKFPKPLGIVGFAIDKLELDKAGKVKCETSCDKSIHHVDGLKLEVKTDLVDLKKVTAGCNYTAIKDTVIKLETKPMDPQDFTAEVIRKVHPTTTVGCALSKANLKSPDIAVRFLQGGIFASLLVKKLGADVTAHCAYEIKSGTSVAATYQQGGKDTGTFSAGISHKLDGGLQVRAKIQQDKSVSVGLKKELAKGFVVSTGTKYDTKSGSYTYGVSVSVE
eukprot:gnl/TRDRNA2_/TRDRNA2_182386_c0_seq1.p1 gnl/TRDRNA2_/TRDRNA2_182386_c0~~gnl/TRDRNA2_/TRDRNA2_182386_c0_seq1.p1  ORF type:complete len:284 (+),score=71.86 gnl/TRDRNA2_/TRDRNA2_182386_c0_seq1:63-914(+)